MKTVLRVLILGLFAAVFAATATTSTFAQDICADFDSNKTLYQKFLDNYQGTKSQIDTAINAAREYVQKYAACSDFKAQVDYLKSAEPSLRARIKEIEEQEIADRRAERYDSFDRNMKAKNWNSTYRVGATILAEEPNKLDVILTLGSIGLDLALARPANDTYNRDTINYAKSAIQKLNSGMTSKNFGAYQFSYKTKDNALGWMNYTIGQIMFQRQGRSNPAIKEQALIYLYRASMANSETKALPALYGTLGDYYRSKVVEFGKKREVYDAKDEANFEKIDNLFGLEKAYAERGADAYARAYNLAKASKSATPAYRKLLLDSLTALYKFRFSKTGEPDTGNEAAKINTFVASVIAKPLPNPTSAVTPIIEKKPGADDNTDDSTGGTSRTRTVSNKPATQ